MLKLRISQRSIDAFLVLLLFCISGNPAFTSIQPLGKAIYGIFLVVLLITSGFKIKIKALKTSAFWIILLATIFFAQYLKFGYITVLGSVNFIIKMLSAILLASYIGDRFPSVAIRVMAGICAISLVFYLINLTGVRFHSPITIGTKGESLIIYTQTWEDPLDKRFFRNSGMFWEPGAFAGYIVATLMLFADKLKLLWTRYLPEFVLLSVTLVTTLSTTGYITFFLLILYYTIRWGIDRKKRLLSYALITVFVLAGVIAFTQLDFLGRKIQKELRSTENLTEVDVSDSRSGSLMFDLPYIMSSPVFGNGLALSTRLRFHLGVYEEEDLDGFSNGFSGCIASMGLLFMLAYLIAIGLNPTLRAKWLIILFVILLLQGEYFLNYPLFMLFPFVCYGPPMSKRSKRKRLKIIWHKKASDESQF